MLKFLFKKSHDRLTKLERESIINDILDRMLEFTNANDLEKELRSIWRDGLNRSFTPLAQRSDKELVRELIWSYAPATFGELCDCLGLHLRDDKLFETAKHYERYVRRQNKISHL